ncbi:MAG: rRNA maturation RNase YbeY [Hydrogenophilales bacterium]|jgi:probable rRNA maturation factor|nr:rRNA maturation RNase YbeY [Hydrogenophilales bacterium]
MPGAIPKLELAIQFAVKAELPGRAEFRRWARSALRTDVSAALRVVDAEEGIALNRDYRGKDSATNVLTFEYGPDPDSGALTGDIVLCAPVVEREAAGQGKTLAAHYAHLTIHGMLHLQGYDHETGEADAIAMEAVESFIMQALGFPNPYNPL